MLSVHPDHLEDLTDAASLGQEIFSCGHESELIGLSAIVLYDFWVVDVNSEQLQKMRVFLAELVRCGT